MSLSQTQIIRSLGEALSWFERELSWGAPISELRHLTGRIGELYTAMVKRGQMALSVNQVGYDVVSAEGERISVKTFTTSTKITFNPSTLHHADRVMILQIVLDENEPSIRELLDCPIDDLRSRLKEGSYQLSTSTLFFPLSEENTDLESLKIIGRAKWQQYEIIQRENGSVQVRDGEDYLKPSKPKLREVAKEVGVDIMNAMGNAKNTRSLGADIINAIGETSIPNPLREE